MVYLNRYYVEHQNKPTLTDVGIACWKKEVFDIVVRDVTGALLSLVKAERAGEQVDRSLIKHSVDVYEAAGEGSLDVYEEFLEAPLIDDSKVFFRSRAEEWIRESVPTYLAKVRSYSLVGLIDGVVRRITRKMHHPR